MGETWIVLLHHPITTAQTLAPELQDGGARIWDIFAALLYSESKWRRFVHLYIQSVVQTLACSTGYFWNKEGRTVQGC